VKKNKRVKVGNFKKLFEKKMTKDWGGLDGVGKRCGEESNEKERMLSLTKEHHQSASKRQVVPRGGGTWEKTSGHIRPSAQSTSSPIGEWSPKRDNQ